MFSSFFFFSLIEKRHAKTPCLQHTGGFYRLHIDGFRLLFFLSQMAFRKPRKQEDRDT